MSSCTKQNANDITVKFNTDLHYQPNLIVLAQL
jgi:hypothetical protein